MYPRSLYAAAADWIICAVAKRGDDGGVEDVARVDEGLRCRVGELGEAGDGLLRGDKGAESVDVGIFGKIGELERERVIGRVGGHCTAFTDSTREKPTRFRAFIHTIVNDNAWDTQRCPDLRECIDNTAGICQVALDVDLVGSIIGLGRFPRGQSNLVAFRRKSFGYTRADSGSGAENEDNRGCGSHGASCGRAK